MPFTFPSRSKNIPNHPTHWGGEISAFHILVIVLSLTLTLGAWQFSRLQIEARTQTRFEAARDNVIGLIKTRMQKYEDTLWSGVAAIDSHGGEMSHDEWNHFAQTLHIGKRYPGINGIGVIEHHTAQTLNGFLEKQTQTRPDFKIYPEHSHPIKLPITYIEPEATNKAAIGLDVAHERNRRTAAFAARDTGTAQITGPITLVQDANKTPGFLFYTPFYRGPIPTTTAQRQEEFLGTVYAPFVVEKLVDGLLAENLRNVRFSISDENDLIYDEHAHRDARYDPNPMFSEQVTIALYGRKWDLDIRTDGKFRLENTQAKPVIILIAGLMIECLIIGLLFSMSRANRLNLKYAEQVNEALKNEAANIELSQERDDMERLIYVASHDLRTPVRAIGGLTEMIQEDLAEYLATPSVNPEIQENLDFVQERVQRMNQLINAILQFGELGRTDRENTPFNFQDQIAELTRDFELQPGQITLQGDVDEIYVDTFSLRCTLENLVGNAVKYHTNATPLHIAITTKSDGERCQISVTDNGPGIDPKYHTKIFDFFQTLRMPNAPESSGIGLSIVKKAVERLDGTVTITSTLGHGATFTFDWPIHEYTLPHNKL